MLTWKSHAGFKFHFGQNDLYEIHTDLSFISAQFMRTQVKSWLNTEVGFSTEMKSHTSLFCHATSIWMVASYIKMLVSCVNFLNEPIKAHEWLLPFYYYL